MLIKCHDGVLRHHIYTGQSNSIQKFNAGGYVGRIMTDPPAPHSALMFNGSLNPTWPGDLAGGNEVAVQAGPIPPANMASLMRLGTVTGDGREGHAFGLAERLYASAPGLTLHSLHGVNGYSYAQLRKGSQPYENVLAAARAGRKAAARMGLRHEVSGIHLFHGETDFQNANYLSNLSEWCSDFRSDLLAITGQDTPIRVLATQVANWCWTASNPPAAPSSPLAQLAAHEAGILTLVCPTYHVEHDAGDVPQKIHYASYGVRMIGEKMADALLPGSWSPLRPTTVQAGGSAITVSFAGRQGSLQFKTGTNGVVDPGNYGFRLCDAAGAALGGISISSVSLINGNTQVRISCSTTVPAGAYLSYADYGTPGTIAGPTEGPRGCLTDSDTTIPSPDLQAYRKDVMGQSDAAKVDPLVNWCVVFRKPIAIV